MHQVAFTTTRAVVSDCTNSSKSGCFLRNITASSFRVLPLRTCRALPMIVIASVAMRFFRVFDRLSMRIETFLVFRMFLYLHVSLGVAKITFFKSGVIAKDIREVYGWPLSLVAKTPKC